MPNSRNAYEISQKPRAWYWDRKWAGKKKKAD